MRCRAHLPRRANNAISPCLLRQVTHAIPRSLLRRVNNAIPWSLPRRANKNIRLSLLRQVDDAIPRSLLRQLSSAIPLFWFLACASQSRLVSEAPWPDQVSALDVSTSLVVPYPPPLTKIQTVPPPPNDANCAYLDGYFSFTIQGWQWVEGSWVRPQPGCAFARPRLFWHTAQTDRYELRFRPGRWVRASNITIECPPASPCSGTTGTLP